MSANDIFMGSAVPAAKFANPGDSIRGIVVRDPVASQQREYDRDNPGAGELAFWPKSGQPKMQATIDIQTDLRDPMIDGDDGVRRVYVKDHGGRYEKGSGRIRDAVRDAVLAAGAKGVETGGWIEFVYTGPGVGKGAIPPKLFRVTYRAPQAGQQGQAQPAQTQQPQTFITPVGQPTTMTTTAAHHPATSYATPAGSILAAMQNHQGQPQQTEPPF